MFGLATVDKPVLRKFNEMHFFKNKFRRDFSISKNINDSSGWCGVDVNDQNIVELKQFFKRGKSFIKISKINMKGLHLTIFGKNTN